VKNDDVMDLIVVFCIFFVFMPVLYCFCVAIEFSVKKYNTLLWAVHTSFVLRAARCAGKNASCVLQAQRSDCVTGPLDAESGKYRRTSDGV